MKVTLAHRHYGIHTDVAETEVPGEFGDYATPTGDRGDYVIDEERLLAALPDGFLPVAPGRVLLATADGTSWTFQDGRTHFRAWGKYFDAYCLNLLADDEQQQEANDGR